VEIQTCQVFDQPTSIAIVTRPDRSLRGQNEPSLIRPSATFSQHTLAS
jgi:hypothetical protein